MAMAPKRPHHSTAENEGQHHNAAEYGPEERDLYAVEFPAQLLGECLKDDKREGRKQYPEGAPEISRERTPITVEEGLDSLFDGHPRA
jgi:hypothetical protein